MCVPLVCTGEEKEGRDRRIVCAELDVCVCLGAQESLPFLIPLRLDDQRVCKGGKGGSVLIDIVQVFHVRGLGAEYRVVF